MGYKVSVPLVENIKYDLIGDLNGSLHRVQVKSSTSERYPNKFVVATVTRGGNRSGVGKKSFIEDSTCDYVFIYAGGKTYLIPSKLVSGKYCILVGDNHWDKFLI